MPRPPSAELSALEHDGLLRRCRSLEGPAGPVVFRDGRELHNFASNDYLGLAGHPEIRQAFHEGLDRWGHGSAASRLITGTQPPHVRLEEEIAATKSCEAALTFSSGFATALGILPAIVGKNDFVLLDKLSHASLIDGARLSEATLRVFPHNDLGKLERLLVSIRSKHADARILIVTESVFSMDGDLCPLREILDLRDRHDALLLLDEAHGFGVLGPTGMGLAEELGVQERVDFHMGTLSKAAGLAGAYVACSADWRDLLVNRARSFIYSTAPPPALAHAAGTALRIIRSKAGRELRSRLHRNIAVLSQGSEGVPPSSSKQPLGGTPSLPTPIVPILLGENQAALAVSAALERSGFLVPAIRYPTVPRGTARLRISLSAAHADGSVAALRQELASVI